MSCFFLEIVNLSIKASGLILAVILIRLAFNHKIPKTYYFMLWIFVGFRLIIPFSVESKVYLFPSFDFQIEGTTGSKMIQHNDDESALGISDQELTIDKEEYTDRYEILIILTCTWLIGIGTMVAYMLLELWMLKLKLRTATVLKEGIKQSEWIKGPFVLGIVKPIIYLPYSIIESDLEYILAHEKMHIIHRDYIWKVIGYCILIIHWFNPLVWIAFNLFSRDMEYACDERVIRDKDKKYISSYSKALLRFCSVHSPIHVTPVPFGNHSVKQRIKNITEYKKPKVHVLGLALVITAVVVVLCFLAKSEKQEKYINDSDSGNAEVQRPAELQSIKGVIIQSNQGYFLCPVGENEKNILFKLSRGYSDTEKNGLTYASGEVVLIQYYNVFDLNPQVIDVVNISKIDGDSSSVDRDKIRLLLKNYSIDSDY